MDASATSSTETINIIRRAKDLPAAHPHEWHWPEYGVELVGTAWNVFIGLSAVIFNFAPGMPGARLIPDPSLRLWVTGLIFAGSGSLYTISPWGRLSGSHINPSVTLGFYAQGKVHWHDMIGYLAAQFAGGALGATLLALAWGPHAAAVSDGMTLPGTGYTVAQAFTAEFLMTFSYVLAIFFFVSSHALARWTPLMNWVVVAGLVWIGAGVSGTSLNPARSFGPALVAQNWHTYWIYLVAPPLGAVLAAGFFRAAVTDRKVLTAKLFHSTHYRSIFKHIHLPNVHLPHRG